MSDDRGSTASGVILSFILGGLTGAALAVLFAPRSGEETRELLGERLREGADKGRRVRDRAVARGRDWAEHLHQGGGGLAAAPRDEQQPARGRRVRR